MKKLLFLIIFCAVASITYAQDCKYETNIIDEFTGIRHVITYTAMATPLKQLKKEHIGISISMELIDSMYYVRLQSFTLKSVFIEENQLAYFKLNNDSIIQLPSLNTNLKPELINDCYVITQRYPIDKNVLSSISEIGIKKIRMQTTEGNIDSDMSETGMSDVRQFIHCILNPSDPNTVVPEVKKKVKKNFP